MVYVGSKARLAKYIVPILQKCINNNKIEAYIEPFVGGANIIDKINYKNKFGYDSHQGLIKIYKSVQNGWIPPLYITEEDYKNAKSGKTEEPLKSYIGFNGSYASKYFGGFARGFKADGITPRDIYNERTRNFINQIPTLLNINFECKNYLDINVKNCLIYCDPPYAETTEYSTARFDHRVFWNWVRQISSHNLVYTSEFTAPSDFISIWSKNRASSLDKNTGGKKDVENLFVYKEKP